MSDSIQPAPADPADIQPTPEAMENARRIINGGAMYAVDESLYGEGHVILHVKDLGLRIAEYLTRHDRETARWVNQEIQEKTESLQRAFVVEAERRMDAQLEVDRLKKLIERDQAGLAAGLAQVRQIIKGCAWLGNNGEWGCYEFDEQTEQTLRGEIERCLDAVDRAALWALQRSGANVTEAFHGTTWTHDLPKDADGLEQCIERLRRTDGVQADAAVIVWEQCQALVGEIDRLRDENTTYEKCLHEEEREIHKTLTRACETLGKPWRKSKDWPTLYGGVTPSICADDVLSAFENEVDRLRAALAKINDIRNSIVGLQTVNWSEHVYPLVKVLDEVGLKGMPYPDAKEQYGTMLDRTVAAETEIDRLRGVVNKATTTGIEIAEIAEKEILRLRAALERIACRDQGEVGPHMEEPRSAAIAREVLGR